MFTNEQLDRAATSLRAGEYNLLLGAASSLGSMNGNSVELPLADEFRTDLCGLKKAKPSHSLQRVFQILTESEVEEHVTGRFSGCVPGPALRSIPRFLWRRIFSLNIDDALEAAYSTGDPYQVPVVRNYRDPYEEVRESANVPIIHLHGFVQRPSDGYVFSREAYLQVIKTANPWMVVLSQLLSSEPFFIVGSSLDEVDLDYFLSLRSQASSRVDRGPSVLVEPFGDVITDRECERLDLIRFPGTAEEFFAYLEGNVQSRPRPRDLVPQDARAVFVEEPTTLELSSFYTDFEKVPAAAPIESTDPRFFFGHVPSWSDLSQQYDVARQINNELMSRTAKVFSGESTDRLVFFSDSVGVGKSTAIRRVGFDLARQGVTVLACSAVSRLEPRFTADMLSRIAGRCVVLVDDFADQVYSVESILSLCDKTDLVFLAAERSYRHRFITEVMAGVRLGTSRGSPLSLREANQLIDTYIEGGLVGDATFIRDKNSAAEKLVSEPIAVACCRILNDLRPLDRIVDSILSAGTRVDRLRYMAAALAQFCTKSGIRFDLLIASVSGAGINTQFNGMHPLPLTLSEEPGRNYVIPLNGTIASRLLEVVSETYSDELFGVFVSIGIAIASRVNRRTIVQRTPEARLAGRLFDLDQVVQRFLGDRAEEFYAETENEWRWNSRYWEQLALLNLYKFQSEGVKQGLPYLDLAVAHARHAVSIERHPLTLTTMAKILFNQAVHLTDGADGVLVSEAVRSTGDAISMERQRSRSSVHPYVVLFQGLKGLPNKFELNDAELTTVRGRLDEARKKFPRDPEIMALIEEVSSRFA